MPSSRFLHLQRNNIGKNSGSNPAEVRKETKNQQDTQGISIAYQANQGSIRGIQSTRIGNLNPKDRDTRRETKDHALLSVE